MLYLLGLSLASSLAVRTVFAIPQQTIYNSSTTFSTASAPAPTATRTSIVSLPEDDEFRTCWSSHYSWSVLSREILDARSTALWTPVSVIPTYVSTACCWDVTEKTTDIPITTLCDGYPRLVRPPHVFHSQSSTTTLYNYTVRTQGELPSMTSPLPHCSMENDEPSCTRFWAEWNSHSYYHTSYDNSIYYGQPPCTSPVVACPTTQRCTVSADVVTMYYWPQTTTSGDFCARNGTTVTPAPTDPPHPNTVTSDSFTFTSPSVYMMGSRAFGWVRTGYYHHHDVGYLCGTSTTAFTYSADPSDISTAAWLAKGDIRSMDWTDLTTIHRDAFERNCYRPRCTRHKTIPAGETPYVVVPSGVRFEEKEWEMCEGREGFIPVLVPLGEEDDDGDGDGKKFLVTVSRTVPASANAVKTQAETMPTSDLDSDSDTGGDGDGDGEEVTESVSGTGI